MIDPYRRADSGVSAILYRSVQVKAEIWREDDAPRRHIIPPIDSIRLCDERSAWEPGDSCEIGEVPSKLEEPSAVGEQPEECGELT